MDIKERFYANLNMIREDYEKDAADWSKKLADNARFAKSQAKADHLLARIDPDYRKEKEKEAKHYKKLSKKYAKKAVTGMDEETEQLDELYGKGSLKNIRKSITKSQKKTGMSTAERRATDAKSKQARSLEMIAGDEMRGPKFWLKKAKKHGDSKRNWKNRKLDKIGK